MFMVLKGAFVARDVYKSAKSVDYHSLMVTDTDSGKLAKLNCTKEIYDAIPGLLFQTGEYDLSLDIQNFAGRTSFEVIGIALHDGKKSASK